jgi:hypothetical protein
MKNYFINGQSMVMVMLSTLHAVKYNEWFPVDTGNLRENATKLSDDGFTIEFNEDVAPYIPFLEYGSSPHYIPYKTKPGAYFHPGSRKHVGFIKDKSSITATTFIAAMLDGKEYFYVND